MSYHIRPIRLRSWFPPDDPVAAAVARLCILREDLFLELIGVIAAEAPTFKPSAPESLALGDIDANEPGYRRMYFWRNSLRTLEEIRHGLNKVNAQRAFRDALALESSEVRAAFEELKSEMNKTAAAVLSDLRNTIGAHLDPNVLQKALNEMDPAREGLLQVADIRGKTRYKFAGDLLVSILLKGVPNKEQQGAFETLIGHSAKLSRAIKAIDDVFNCYARTVVQRRPIG